MPGPAWLLLSKTGPPFSASLYRVGPLSKNPTLVLESKELWRRCGGGGCLEDGGRVKRSMAASEAGLRPLRGRFVVEVGETDAEAAVRPPSP